MAVGQLHRVDKMVSQMGNVFKKDHFVAHRNVVYQDEVLMDLAHVADVRHDRDVKLPRQQADRQDIIPNLSHPLRMNKMAAFSIRSPSRE